MRARQPRGGERVRFVGMDDIHSPRSHHSPDRESGAQPAPSRVDAVCGDACILRATSQQRIANRNQFGSVAMRQQSSQQEQRLVLTTTKVPAKVDNEGAQA